MKTTNTLLKPVMAITLALALPLHSQPLFATEISVIPAPSAQAGQIVEVAFILDTTGSMADLIDGAKKKIWSIANTIIDTNPDATIRMALIAYRDRGDEYVLKTYPLSTDVQSLYAKLIKLEADGGGDQPESVNEALDKGIRSLQWDQGANVRRIVFLVGDAPPHMDYRNAPKYPQVLKQANQKNIIVNAVQAGDDGTTRTVWKDIARLGQGRYIQIPQDGGQIQHVETPYDDEILRYQAQLDNTVLPYGSRQIREAVAGKMATKSMGSKESQVENSRYYSKKSGKKEVVTGGGDLISDVAEGQVKISAIKSEDLPAVLQNKTAEEQKQIVDEYAGTRKQLEGKITSLVKSRDAYIEKQRASAPAKVDSFDTAVKASLREQLK